ncbi:DUF2125 domain-containing protein [Paracoccus bogoriensis]|uniref:DUF2125 domain-containing protein n=1 Tax=Paracoccus bogoriensis TaxID=242065 RepID=UPI001C67E46B|nr:DUF2125 domain-containing protein [Paracoccus bogoriensis]MBW7057195.1 DUF2125 domain-containing protein [Paracoccus bogoriensis]
MRRAIIVLTILLALLAGGIWFGGEILAANRLKAEIEKRPDLAAASVAPLRAPPSLGVMIEAPRIGPGSPAIRADQVRLLVDPLAPLTLRLVLPDRLTLTLDGRDLGLTGQDLDAEIGFSPLHGRSVKRARMQGSNLALDGQPLARAADLQLDLNRLGFGSPRAARAAYRVMVRLDDLSPQALSPLVPALATLGTAISIEGEATLWLDAPFQPDDPQMPRLVGGQSAGMDLWLGGQALRVIGRITPDAAGLAEGQVAVYARDAGAVLDVLAAAGLLPDTARLLVEAGLSQLARAEIAPPFDHGPAMPPPAEGELRLLLTMADGRMSIGPVPIGPAPLLTAPPAPAAVLPVTGSVTGAVTGTVTSSAAGPNP